MLLFRQTVDSVLASIEKKVKHLKDLAAQHERNAAAHALAVIHNNGLKERALRVASKFEELVK